MQKRVSSRRSTSNGGRPPIGHAVEVLRVLPVVAKGHRKLNGAGKRVDELKALDQRGKADLAGLEDEETDVAALGNLAIDFFEKVDLLGVELDRMDLSVLVLDPVERLECSAVSALANRGAHHEHQV
ncbi:MAG TPA: hypothetical protein VGC54_04620, partial [Planctomycetota bacterium]